MDKTKDIVILQAQRQPEKKRINMKLNRILKALVYFVVDAKKNNSQVVQQLDGQVP